ncbi:endospore germination permease [Paenibacillus solisilvae]|uniref:Endospore germination permease n=1 Tax=Paenibacillus solisilvae TaxID=2486751 RepID=A0ABW0VUK1_9BACL
MSRFQLFAFILQTQIGIGVLAFPYELHKASGVDGWISILMAGGVIQLLLLAYIALCRRFPNRNLFEFAPLLLGKVFGNLVTILYIVHFALTSCIILLLELVLVQLWVLPFSNPWPIIVVNGIILIYFAKENIRIIARYHTLITFIIVLMLALLFFGLDNFDYRYLLPIGQHGWQALITGMKSSIISFLGFELLLVVNSDVKAGGKSLIAPMLWANGAAASFYLLVVLACSLNFGPEAISQVPQPVPFYLNGISLPFLERLDLLFLSMWLVKVTATLTSYVYATGKGLSCLFHRKEHRKAVYYVAPLVCLSGIFWRSESGIEYLAKVIEMESYVMLGLPVALLLLSWLTGKKEEQLA